MNEFSSPRALFVRTVFPSLVIELRMPAFVGSASVIAPGLLLITDVRSFLCPAKNGCSEKSFLKSNGRT